ncbi:MAG: Crp/Fnr family transcriptional regulator [Pseudorhodoplanes sp.]|uniref:Crp/Fnr family transcriptional regulator n=1 Tax=Pseudorhodoplanes sp. TaxID=1934341 RepID=UPI003D0C0DDE
MPHLQNKLFDFLPRADRIIVGERMKPFAAEIGTELQEVDQPVEHIYFPNTGMVSLLIVLRDGIAVESATVGNEGTFGTSTALVDGLSANRAVVQMPLTATRISVSDFLLLFNGNDPFRKLIARANEMLINQFQQTAACNARHQVEARCARWLLQSHDRVGNGALPLTQEYLANMLAVRRSTVNEVAQALQAEGLIGYTRGSIEVIDRAGLENKACECYSVLARQRRRLLGIN